MKDIFIDNNIAKNFSNPLDPEYKKLISWLLKHENNENTDAYLVVSQKLLVEYQRSAMGAISKTSIPIIIEKLQREGRLIKFSKNEIEQFKKAHFSKKVQKNFRSNQEDRELIPVVLLSNRKYALSLDENFTYDLENFPRFDVRVEKRPENLPYSEYIKATFFF